MHCLHRLCTCTEGLQINPTQFLDTINTINEHLIEAYSLQHSFIDTALAFFTLQLSRLVLRSHHDKVNAKPLIWSGSAHQLPTQEMARLRSAIDDLNTKVYNPVGLNILWPRKMAFMFVSGPLNVSSQWSKAKQTFFYPAA